MVNSLSAVVTAAGVGAAFDPTTQPSRGSFWVFVFMASALVLLMISMVRHMRRADRNLSPATGQERADDPTVRDQPR